VNEVGRGSLKFVVFWR